MKKIPSIFVRGADGNLIDECHPEALWVHKGEGVATRKYDGTCCLVRDGVLYRRYDAKHGKAPPEGFEPAQEPDPVTGHWPGWIRVRPEDESSRWHIVAVASHVMAGARWPIPDGTYELCGPKLQGNPESLEEHRFLSHERAHPFFNVPTCFAELKEYFRDFPHEGLVWHHPDGRMAKARKADFWPTGERKKRWL